MTPRLLTFILLLALIRSSLAQSQAFTEVVPVDFLCHQISSAL